MAIFRRCLAALLFVSASAAHAQPSGRFDLPGPKIDIRVTRNGILLPIASVPNLQPGDQVWLHPDLPLTQSVHYLLIAAFLRGTTNPPPDNWFTRIETWDRKVREEGVTITVPAEAEQAILFLAPETGGDFSTLRSAVKGRPGVFVRASQDLAEAGFEQGRIEKYLAAMKQVPAGDPKALQEHSDLLARTLNLKPNPDCSRRPLDQQYNCLTQTGTQTLLDDGHAQSVAAALSTGPTSDFINAASYTSLAGAGTYSAYVGAIVDLVRLTSGLHTAKYQYIPAIAFPTNDASRESLDLRLNTPPSFNNPKSVIVIGLPAVQKTVPPPLRPVDPNHISCMLDPHLALPIEGAPLVFSTAFAHDLVLHLNSGGQKDIPLVPDAYQGGLVFDPNASDRHELTPGAPSQSVSSIEVGSKISNPGTTITGTIEGSWGFDHFTGPTLPLQQVAGSGWHIVPSSVKTGGPDTLIVGQPNHLQLISSGTACVQSVSFEPTDAKVDWKLAHSDRDSHKPPATNLKPEPLPEPLDVALTLSRDTAPGSIHLSVRQFGAKEPEIIGATAFVEPAHIETLQLHAGDTTAVLTGASLDQVKSLTFKDLTYVPKSSSIPTESAHDGKSLNLTLPADAKSPALHPNEKLSAEVHLRDGRTLTISTLVLAARPEVTILSRRVSKSLSASIALGSANDLALGSQLVFFLKSKTSFLRTDQVEIANQADDSAEPLRTTLSVAAGTLILQDTHTILATFDPLKTFGPSTFGPFHLRPVAADGTTGDWIPLATIVRLPTFNSLVCPAPLPTPAPADCTLTGSALYLIDAISLDSDFTMPTRVPEGFVETSLAIPHPPPNEQPAIFYIHLRDDPTTAQQVTLNVQTDTPTPPAPRTHGVKAAPPTETPLATTPLLPPPPS
jgi:hypothetical protein